MMTKVPEELQAADWGQLRLELVQSGPSVRETFPRIQNETVADAVPSGPM